MAKIKSAENGTKKDFIISRAAGLFRQNGYASSSMRELAELIGVEAPSLYNHIGSKSELLQQICMQVASTFMEELNEITSRRGTASQQLEAVTRFHIRMMMDQYDEVYVSNHDWKFMKEPFLTEFLAMRKAYEQRLVKIIQTGIENGEMKNLNAHVVLLSILSAVRGLEFWQRHKKEIPADVLEDTIVNHLLNGLIK